MIDTLEKVMTPSEMGKQVTHPLFSLNNDHEVEFLDGMNMWTWFLDSEEEEEAVYLTLTFIENENAAAPFHLFGHCYQNERRIKEAMNEYVETFINWMQEHPSLRLYFLTHSYPIQVQFMIG